MSYRTEAGDPAAPILRYRNAAIVLDQPSGPRSLVRGLDLEVHRGEIVALVGESGSGKSLTALSTLGLLAPKLRLQADEARLCGQDLLQCTARDWRRLRGTGVGMVFQEPLSALNPVLTVGEQITEILRYKTDLDRRQRHERALQLLREVEIARLPHILDDYPHQLSGGMRQRVMIAMAMAAQPALLVADEPTTALDNTVQRQVLELIARTVERSQVGVLFITHDLSVVAQLADRVVVMQQGEAVERGAVTSLFDAPAHAYTRRLIALAPKRPPQNAIEDEAATAPATAPLLRLDNVTKHYRGRETDVAAVDQVSLSLYPGRTLGLVGESGSGKSSLGRIVAGLMQPDSGRVHCDGRDDRDDSKRRGPGRQGLVQMVFQDTQAALNPRLRIGDIIAEPLWRRAVGDRHTIEREVARLLEAVGLPAAMAARWPHQLSGGQRQRVGIARALAPRPRLLVCDEPVSALDVSIQQQILDLLKQLQPEYGLSYLFIAHGLDSVYQISDEVAVMQHGRIVEQGSRAQIFHAPRHPYTRALLDAMLDADPRTDLFGRRRHAA